MVRTVCMVGSVFFARRSKILPILFKFEIGRKFESGALSRAGFLRIGVTLAVLSNFGNTPC